jgi:hypothetical protein
MKITIIVMSILSLTSLIYAMDNDERADGDGRTLGDLLTAKKAHIQIAHVNNEPKEAEIIIDFNGISSLACNNFKKDLAPWVTKLRHSGSYLTHAKLTDLYIFENLQELKLENCFIQQLEFDIDKVLSALKLLSLARNYLKKVELTKILTMAPQLEELDLSLNPIEEIVLENEYQHENFLTINLEKTNYSEQLKSNEFINKLFNSTHGKKLLIKW